MKKLLLLVSFVFMGVALFGCSNQAVMETSDIDLFANNLIGAYDKDTGKIGFIDSTGQYVIEPQYDDIIRTFDETKTASVVKDDMYMTINESGKQLNNKKYGLFNGYTIHSGYNTDSAQLIDSNGNIVFESESGKLRYTTGNEYVIYFNQSGYGLIDLDGDFVYQPEYDTIQVLNDHYFGIENENGYAIGDESGNLLTDFEYKYLTGPRFLYDQNYIYCADEYNHNQIFNMNTEEFLDFGSGIWSPSSVNRYGLVMVTDGTFYGIDDIDGNQIIPMEYKFVDFHFHDGMFIAAENAAGSFPNHYYLYDTSGELVYDTDQYMIVNYNANYMTVRNSVGEYAILDLEGNIIHDFGVYNDAVLTLSDNGIYAKSLDTARTDYWEIYDSSDQLLMTDVSFHRATDGFVNGFMIVKTDHSLDTDSYRFIDETGNVLDVPVFYDSHMGLQLTNNFFQDGFAIITTKGADGYQSTLINSNGDVLFTTREGGLFWQNPVINIVSIF